MADPKCEIIKNIGVVSTEPSGWQTELNLARWGDNAPKYDLRPWAPEHKRLGKGLTLTKEELFSLADILNAEVERLSKA